MSTAHAAGLMEIADRAGPTVGPFLWCIVILMLIATFGGVGHLFLYMIDNTKWLKLVDKGTYLGLIGTVISMGVMVIGNIVGAVVKVVQWLVG